MSEHTKISKIILVNKNNWDDTELQISVATFTSWQVTLAFDI